MNVWTELGIEPTDDIRIIKRAYAQHLKKIRPEEDPDAFSRLRDAYETALAHASATDLAPVLTDAYPANESSRKGAATFTSPASWKADWGQQRACPTAWSVGLLVPDLLSAVLAVSEAERGQRISQALADPRLDSLDARAALVDMLIENLSRDFERWEPIMPACFVAFGWQVEDAPTHRDSPSARLISRYRLRQWCRSVQASGGLRSQALRWLREPPDEAVVPKLSRSRKNRNAVSSLLDQVVAVEWEILLTELNLDAVRWWTHRIHQQRNRQAVRRARMNILLLQISAALLVVVTTASCVPWMRPSLMAMGVLCAVAVMRAISWVVRHWFGGWSHAFAKLRNVDQRLGNLLGVWLGYAGVVVFDFDHGHPWLSWLARLIVLGVSLAYVRPAIARCYRRTS